MTIAELPQAFEELEMKGIERQAARLFLEKAMERVPDVRIIGPRRTYSQFLKLVVDYPEEKIWESARALSAISNEVRDETGVYFILD